LHNWRRDHWNPAVRAAGLEHRTPYSLRHTYASFAIAAGVSLFSSSPASWARASSRSTAPMGTCYPMRSTGRGARSTYSSLRGRRRLRRKRLPRPIAEVLDKQPGPLERLLIARPRIRRSSAWEWTDDYTERTVIAKTRVAESALNVVAVFALGDRLDVPTARERPQERDRRCIGRIEPDEVCLLIADHHEGDVVVLVVDRMNELRLELLTPEALHGLVEHVRHPGPAGGLSPAPQEVVLDRLEPLARLGTPRGRLCP